MMPNRHSSHLKNRMKANYYAEGMVVMIRSDYDQLSKYQKELYQIISQD
jgi:hypothetical protein